MTKQPQKPYWPSINAHNAGYSDCLNGNTYDPQSVSIIYESDYREGWQDAEHEKEKGKTDA